MQPTCTNQYKFLFSWTTFIRLFYSCEDCDSSERGNKGFTWGCLHLVGDYLPQCPLPGPPPKNGSRHTLKGHATIPLWLLNSYEMCNLDNASLLIFPLSNLSAIRISHVSHSIQFCWLPPLVMHSRPVPLALGLKLPLKQMYMIRSGRNIGNDLLMWYDEFYVRKYSTKATVMLSA